jgi:hypothetical protein
MLVPSRLKLYPIAMTSPTTEREAPSYSILRIMCGSTAASEELVPSTINSSSLM